MTLADAKTVLTDVLSKHYADSLVLAYTERDSISSNIIVLQKEELTLLAEKFDNQKTITDNLNEVLTNKDKEIETLNGVIKKQKREIVKQKIQKIIGFSAAVALPILVLIFAK
jgi:fructose-1,6-bisphosphatase/sedoheptulose 1,7-bisphosphatase-like protein